MPSNGTTVNVILHDFDINFQVQTFQVAFLQVKAGNLQTLLMLSDRESGIRIEWRHCECCTFRDLDIKFQGHKFELLLSRKW